MEQHRTSQILLGVFALTLVVGSFAEDVVRPRMQALFSMVGQGNEQVFLAADERMYFRPALEHVWGAPMVDARPAISHVGEGLLRVGIELVVVPVPVKVSLDGTPMGIAGMPIPTTFLADRDGVVLWIDQADDSMLRSDPDRVRRAIRTVFA